MFPNVSRGYGIALALMGLGFIAVVAIGCGGGESRSVETAAPTAAQTAQPVATRVAGAAATAPAATQPAQPAATKAAGAVTQAAPFTGDPLARLEALMREEFAGLTNEAVTRFHSVEVRQEPEGSYRVVAEFVSDDVPRTGDEREEILARKRLMEERMQHAFLTLYTSGIDVNNAVISARFRTIVRPRGGPQVEGYLVIYRTWMTREKAAGVKWQDPSLDLRTVWEVPLLVPTYR